MCLFESEKELDPRHSKSEPVSPTGEATFDKDKFLGLDDNVYAEA
jgi:hypothetical protein